MQCELLIQRDFLRQVNMEIYVRNIGINSVKCEIINYNDDYKGNLVVMAWKSNINMDNEQSQVMKLIYLVFLI